MNAIVVYESVYGNTRAIAEAIAEGLGGARVLAVKDASGASAGADLIVAGGPTHMHGLSTTSSRQMAVKGAHEDGKAQHVEEGSDQQPGLREWLHDLPHGDELHAAAFDTRLDKAPWLTGVAAHGIARRLRHRGYEVVGTESFLVQESEGPLEEGELERARAWGAELAGGMGSAGEAGSQRTRAA